MDNQRLRFSVLKLVETGQRRKRAPGHVIVTVWQSPRKVKRISKNHSPHDFFCNFFKSRRQLRPIHSCISFCDVEIEKKAASNYSTWNFLLWYWNQGEGSFDSFNLEMRFVLLFFFSCWFFVEKCIGYERSSLSIGFSTGSLLCCYPITIKFSYLISRCLATSTVPGKQKQQPGNSDTRNIKTKYLRIITRVVNNAWK